MNKFGKQLVFGLVAVTLLVSGCQTSPATKPTGLDNTGFMSLWQTYSDCRATSDVSQAGRDMQILVEAVQLQYGSEGFVLPLPKKLERLVTSPINRFAVDVRAMASACSLHAGQLALDQGHVDLARSLFATVLTLHPQEESSYYLLQAKTLLDGLERGIEISLTTP